MYFWKESNFSETFLHFMTRFREIAAGNKIHSHHLCLEVKKKSISCLLFYVSTLAPYIILSIILILTFLHLS